MLREQGGRVIDLTRGEGDMWTCVTYVDMWTTDEREGIGTVCKPPRESRGPWWDL